MSSKIHYHVQLKDISTGESIIAAGGVCHVATGGTPDKVTLYDKTGAALANPVAGSYGSFDFWTADTVASVDLYIMAPGGQFEVRLAVKASGPNEILVDTSRKVHLAKIPFSYVDQGGDATETDTGFDVPALAYVLNRLHGCGLLITAIDATETIDVGLGEVHPAESGGDANGFIAASSVGTLGLVTGTDGALFSTNAPHKSDSVTAKSISYTLTTGSDTAKGFIMLPYRLV